MYITDAILSIIIMLIIPVYVGSSVGFCLKIKFDIAKSFAIGLFSIWSFLQLVSVPIVLLKGSFIVVLVLLGLFISISIIFSLYKKCIKFDKCILKKNLCVVFLLLVIGTILCVNFMLQHIDADDSRFVVNAVDICRTNKMFIIDPITGLELPTWKGELLKDVTSPWAVYIAVCSKLTGISPVIMAHTIMPIQLFLLMCAIYWLLSEKIVGKESIYRCLFVFFVLLVSVYGYYSVYSAETFAMIRIWQGKAVVASSGVPMLWLASMQIYDEDKMQNYILLGIVTTALCLMSGMGIIIGALMVGCIGIVYGVLKKKIKITFSVCMTALPNLIYYIINCLL